MFASPLGNVACSKLSTLLSATKRPHLAVHLRSVCDSFLARVLNSPWNQTFLRDISRPVPENNWDGGRERGRWEIVFTIELSKAVAPRGEENEVELFSAVTAVRPGP